MKYEDLQKLKFILEEESRYKHLNLREVTKTSLKEYVDKCYNERQDKDDLVNNVYEMWENDHQEKTEYKKMLMKNHIIDYIKGKDKHYSLIIWYFKDNQQPFYINIRNSKDEEMNHPQALDSFLNDFPCDYRILKDNISEVEAIKLKKQIVYYYHVLGLPLLNHKEMK